MPQNYTRHARIHFGKLSVYQTTGRPSQSVLASPLKACPPPFDCGRFIFAQNGRRSCKNKHKQRHSHTDTPHRCVCMCVSINISLAHSPSETPKFCNIYKVAKKRRISPPKPNRIESKRSESGQPSRADRLTEPQKCTQRKKPVEDWVYKKYVYLKSEVF